MVQVRRYRFCRNKERASDKILFGKDCSCGQRVELVCQRLRDTTIFHLAFDDHVYERDATQNDASSDPNVRFVHTPTPADRPLANSGRFLQHRQQFERPEMHDRMVNRISSRSHHLPGHRLSGYATYPAHEGQHHIERIVQTLKHLRHSPIQIMLHRSDRSFSGLQHLSSVSVTTSYFQAAASGKNRRIGPRVLRKCRI